MVKHKIRSISAVLKDLGASLPEDKVCTFDIIQGLHERGIGMLLFIFALPAALPLPGLGINVIIALPLLLLTAQQAIGRHTIWIPERMKYKSVTKARFESVVKAAIPYIEKIELFIKPRLSFVTQGIFSHLIGLSGLIMALSVCIPLPLTNTVPAFGIALMAIGVVMRDGLAAIAGMLIGLLWVGMIAYALLFFGTEGIDLIKDAIRSYI